MKEKTFKIIYAGILIMIGIIVLGVIFANTYGAPLYRGRMNNLGTETILYPTGEFRGLSDSLEMMVMPICVYLLFVGVAGVDIFWVKKPSSKKKRKHG